MIYNPGDFTFLDTVADQTPLKDMYDAITSTSSWAMIKGDPDNTSHKCMGKVNKAMKYEHHTAASYAWAFQEMQYIANHGWNKYVAEHVSAAARRAAAAAERSAAAARKAATTAAAASSAYTNTPVGCICTK